MRSITGKLEAGKIEIFGLLCIHFRSSIYLFLNYFWIYNIPHSICGTMCIIYTKIRVSYILTNPYEGLMVDIDRFKNIDSSLPPHPFMHTAKLLNLILLLMCSANELDHVVIRLGLPKEWNVQNQFMKEEDTQHASFSMQIMMSLVPIWFQSNARAFFVDVRLSSLQVLERHALVNTLCMLSGSRKIITIFCLINMT